MKKFLLTATMLVGLSAVSKAQQGRVGINTTTPSSTLDVVANTTDNARPDALLVPRMTAAELTSKDDTSGTYGAPQNGALVYITSGTGSGARKAKITGAGFYYFDNTVPEWKPFGGGGSTPNAVTPVRTSATGADLSAADLDGYVFLTTNADLSTIPVSAAVKGRSITLVKVGGGTLTVNGVSAASVNSMTVNGRGLGFVYDGTAWQSYSAQ